MKASLIRHLDRLLPCLILVLAIGLFGGCSDERRLESPVRFEGNIFGTFYQITVVDPLTEAQRAKLAEGIEETLAHVDTSMSTYREDSELMQLNRTPVGEWRELSPELTKVLHIARQVARKSDGAFDVTVGGLVNLWSFGPEARPQEVPDPALLAERLQQVGQDRLELDVEGERARRLGDIFIDLSGVAKGYGVDRVADYLRRQGLENFLVNIGGELVLEGDRDDQGDPWRIGVEVPDVHQRVAREVLPLHDATVATSGDYRNYFEAEGKRYSHTIDPRTGRPIDHALASVTVIHPDNAWADAWATALMVLGPNEAMALARRESLPILLLVRDGDGWSSRASPAFTERFGKERLEKMGVDTAQVRKIAAGEPVVNQ
ncbi:FAD:protein FMN transferase [Pistricoccus aurantiacus]|uniref:FAD:protein FMN transferase n=1 Tax=Pistricoccus aurantiacus TaxID=1883414 RepID=A0A5B8SMG4_9GAMM|nr:FAD:protein FMN transferase [Pistricoccus aurantiacus]QEA38332.1 FAD:protein FMN transferase [Pistricoccus aurantiacus]